MEKRPNVSSRYDTKSRYEDRCRIVVYGEVVDDGGQWIVPRDRIRIDGCTGCIDGGTETGSGESATPLERRTTASYRELWQDLSSVFLHSGRSTHFCSTKSIYSEFANTSRSPIDVTYMYVYVYVYTCIINYTNAHAHFLINSILLSISTKLAAQPRPSDAGAGHYE